MKKRKKSRGNQATQKKKNFIEECYWSFLSQCEAQANAEEEEEGKENYLSSALCCMAVCVGV